jgi:hypothetical protein
MVIVTFASIVTAYLGRKNTIVDFTLETDDLGSMGDAAAAEAAPTLCEHSTGNTHETH